MHRKVRHVLLQAAARLDLAKVSTLQVGLERLPLLKVFI